MERAEVVAVKRCYIISLTIFIFYLAVESLLLRMSSNDTQAFLYITWHFIAAPIAGLITVGIVASIAGKIRSFPLRMTALGAVVFPLIAVYFAATGDFAIVRLLSPSPFPPR